MGVEEVGEKGGLWKRGVGEGMSGGEMWSRKECGGEVWEKE